MVIAVNTRLLLKDRLEGIGWFTCESLQRITRQHKEHRFIFIFDRPYNEEFIFADNITPVIVSPPARHPLLWHLWFEYRIPSILKKYKADLFLSPDGFLSLNTSVKSLPVIHDLNFEHYPFDLPYWTSRHYCHFFPQYARKATRIATVSNYSKNDIASTYKINPEMIDVVYNGANELYSDTSPEIKSATKNKYTQGENYFLYVGALNPRKNITSLLLAFDKFKQNTTTKVKLLMVGSRMWGLHEMETVYKQMKHKQDVIFTGRLPVTELKNVLAAALALTYIPIFEGFGIPLVEAMYSDIPIITSNVTSMPEVVGNAAILVNPYSIDAIEKAMLQLASSETARQQLITKGREQRKKFTWQQTADKLWLAIEKTSATP
jgi:glycosyltransferase involved in cell wall biosynthesis